MSSKRKMQCWSANVYGYKIMAVTANGSIIGTKKLPKMLVEAAKIWLSTFGRNQSMSLEDFLKAMFTKQEVDNMEI